jgi:PhoPQ-activated pathogenicity-related protein
MFVYKFLSDESSLKSAFTAKTTEFYGALNTKLITMDDEDFRADPLFSEQQWKDIIQLCIAKAFEISRKLLAVSNKSEKPKMRERLFARKSETEAEFKVLSNLLNNLNKKCLSTNKIPQQYFVSPELDKYLNTFKFGIGAKTIEMMLKSFPFAFGFGSRVKKLQEFIKADKLNHNRSLFQQ